MSTNSDYNGWKNRQTWNVSLWLNNEESLYRAMVEYVKTRAKEGKKYTYKGFITSMCMQDDRTGDNIKYLGSKLCHKELNAMLKELENH